MGRAESRKWRTQMRNQWELKKPNCVGLKKWRSQHQEMGLRGGLRTGACCGIFPFLNKTSHAGLLGGVGFLWFSYSGCCWMSSTLSPYSFVVLLERESECERTKAQEVEREFKDIPGPYQTGGARNISVRLEIAYKKLSINHYYYYYLLICKESLISKQSCTIKFN